MRERAFHAEIKGRPAFLERLGKGLCAEFPDVFVRVLGAGKLQHPHRKAYFSEELYGFVGRPLPRLVAVVIEHHLLGVPRQKAGVFGRDGRAQRGHRVFKPRRLDGDGIHISLAQDHLFGAGLPGKIQPEEHAALFKTGRIGGVEVFGLGIVHDPPAESHNVPRRVNDRKHHAVAEKVKEPARIRGTL